jgi:hypothetical protein
VPIDIRVGVTECDDPATEKLVRRCGEGAFRCWIRLKSYVRLNRPDGKLSGMTAEDAEIASGWKGEPGLFCSTLVSVGLLEAEGEGFSVRDWALTQPYAASSAARSEHARKAAQARWNRFVPENAADTADAPASPEQCSEHLRAMLNGKSGNALFSSSPSLSDPYISDRSSSNPAEEAAGAAPAPDLLESRTQAPKKKRSKPLTAWPEGFALDDQMRSYAIEHGIDAELEFAAFRNWAASKDARYSDWRAAWRTRIDNAPRFGGGARLPSSGRLIAINGANRPENSFEINRRLHEEEATAQAAGAK